jgi:hypothetical protein
MYTEKRWLLNFFCLLCLLMKVFKWRFPPGVSIAAIYILLYFSYFSEVVASAIKVFCLWLKYPCSVPCIFTLDMINRINAKQS